ncbi:MAG: hypothetical protein EBR82_33920 [Caulobacteraceae bacterium]|nr:hypothetical protein [Caulobacteraceae bacterium]
MKPGDLVRISGEGLAFYMWDDAYPNKKERSESSRAVDKFNAGELGVVLGVEDVSYIHNVRAGGIYVKFMNPRGRIGWIIGSNLEVVGEDG